MEKTTEKKMTKAQKFDLLKKIPAVAENPMLVEFIDHEIELLTKKNGSEKKPTKTQIANEQIKSEILDGMEVNHGYTVTEIQKTIPACSELTNQKITSLLRQLVLENKVDHKDEKKKSLYFKVVIA